MIGSETVLFVSALAASSSQQLAHHIPSLCGLSGFPTVDFTLGSLTASGNVFSESVNLVREKREGGGCAY